MNPLVNQHCRPLEGQPPMNAEEISRHLAAASGRALTEGAIQKRCDFPDDHRTMAFVNAVAWVAHVEDHRPDMAVSYDRCTVRFSTQSVGGISVNDFICAAKADALLP